MRRLKNIAYKSLLFALTLIAFGYTTSCSVFRGPKAKYGGPPAEYGEQIPSSEQANFNVNKS